MKRNILKSLSVVLCAAMVLSGCSSLNNTAKGSMIGAAGGAALGLLVGHFAGNKAVGTAVGAAVGAGFEIFETAGYGMMQFLGGDTAWLGKNSIWVIAHRNLLAPGGHVAWSAISGAGLYSCKKRKSRKRLRPLHPLHSLRPLPNLRPRR